ncbi:MAG TPA: DUF4838 domain-containing protein [Thermoguttaceae bacterium]|nr:DUF4838 domain-containing protein [Thermoguttaceae bacterium]
MLRLVEAAPWIVEKGQARAEIVIAEQPPRAVKLAAKELQTYIEKITGARLGIVTAPTGTRRVRVLVGESDHTRSLGVTAEGLGRDAYRMVSGADWLALVGRDWDFKPIEPWARSHGDWLNNKQRQWEALAGHPWLNPIASSMYKDYNKRLDIWNYDHRGSLNAVYAFLRSLGVRWYMPGELGEILPESKQIALPQVDRTVRPAFAVRSLSRPLISSSSIDDALWYLRLGANEQYGILHHGQRYLTEHSKQRAAHPEYYVLMPNGKRDTESEKANACLSSQGFFKEMVAYARLMFDHYHLPIVSVMPHDGFTHCQCDGCRGQATLDREHSGISSDYVWNFVVRVANELATTHPDKKVFCGAYSTYRLPPLSIDKLPDNVLVQITNGRPIREVDDETHKRTAELRRQWQAKTGNPLSVTLNYTPFTDRGEYRPQYWPHVIARGLRDVKGHVWREDVWLSSGKGGLHHPGMSHLNPYVMSQLWWDPDRDVDLLLDEYYGLFYGPAAKAMQDFIDFSEANYAQLGSNAAVTRQTLALFDRAKAAVPSDSVFGRRISLVDAFLTTLRNRAKRILETRPPGLPEFRLIDMGQDKWREARQTLVMDGKLEEPFWTGYSLRGTLKDIHTGKKPTRSTEFRGRWWQDSLYFGIRCQGEPGKPPVIGTRQSGDPAIWDGDHVELLIETDKHSYYQIVVSPAGAVMDLDRRASRTAWYDWSSKAEVAAHVGDGYWSVELRLPITSSEEDPLHKVIGSRPFKAKPEDLATGKGTSLPWHFNLFRKRAGTEDGETTAFSPLGPDAKTFHDRMKLAELYVR